METKDWHELHRYFFLTTVIRPDYISPVDWDCTQLMVFLNVLGIV